MITVTIDTSDLTRKLADFPAALARAQRKALDYIGARVASDATRAFKNASLRPSPWAPRKDKKATHPLLIKHPEGGLWKSIDHRLEGDDTVVIGSDKKYAIYHQQGTKNMPARPFFPIDKYGQLTPRIMRKIKADVEAAYKEEIDRVFGNGGG